MRFNQTDGGPVLHQIEAIDTALVEMETAIDALPTQQDFATLLFSQRETIGRDMSKLKDAGLIERQGRSLVIKSVSRLKARLSGE